MALFARKLTSLEKEVLNVLTAEVLSCLFVQQSLAQSVPSQFQVKNSLSCEAPDRKEFCFADALYTTEDLEH